MSASTRAALLIVVIAELTGCSGGSSPGHSGGAASCVSPTLSVAAKPVRPGGRIRLTGQWFAADCYDTGQAGTPAPLTGLHLRLSQKGHTWAVGTTVNASGPHYTFTTTIELPSDIHPGRATLTVENYGQGAVVHIAR